MVQVLTPMAAREFCTYSTIKIDSELLPLLKGVAGFRKTSTQELASDILNEWLAKELDRKPLKRRTPKPRSKDD